LEGRIGLVTVLTDDIATTKVFYNDVLGFMVIEDLGDYVEFRSVGVRFAVCTRGYFSLRLLIAATKRRGAGEAHCRVVEEELSFKILNACVYYTHAHGVLNNHPMSPD
jgi:catechol 2,3-dioxygenase-like lactoylglutathione lyase family enzyme